MVVKIILFVILGIAFAGVKEVYMNSLGILLLTLAIIILRCAGKVGKTKFQSDCLFFVSVICIIMPFVIKLYQRWDFLPPMTAARFGGLVMSLTMAFEFICYLYSDYWEAQRKEYHNDFLARFGLPTDKERKIMVFKVHARPISNGKEGVYIYLKSDICFKYGTKILVQELDSIEVARVMYATAEEMLAGAITSETPRVLYACKDEDKKESCSKKLI